MGSMILHLADLHLGCRHEYLETDAPVRAEEADGLLDRIAAWMERPGSPEIGLVLLAGDVFDSPMPPDPLVERVARALRRIADRGIAIVTLPGNHDEYSYPDCVYRRWERGWPGTLVTRTDPHLVGRFPLGGLEIEIVSAAFHQGRNTPTQTWNSPFAGPKAEATRRIGLFHGTLDRIEGKVAEGARAFRLELDRLSSWGIDYLALGHIHRRQSFAREGTLAHYPGPIEGKGPDDPGSGWISLVDLHGSDPRIVDVDASALGIRSREVRAAEIDLATVADRRDLADRIGALAEVAGPLSIVQVDLAGTAPFRFTPDEIHRELSPRFLRLKIRAARPDACLGPWETLAGLPTLDGLFVRRVLARRKVEGEERAPFWSQVAEEGLRALGRGEE